MLTACRSELMGLADPQKALILQRFFKTGPGQYGEWDIFLGIQVPPIRKIAQKYAPALSLLQVEELIKSQYHEERVLALFILVDQYKKASPDLQTQIYTFYLAHTKYINNWDLVDLSTPQIVGHYLFNKPKDILFDLLASDDLWKKRIAILATFYDIKNQKFDTILSLAQLALKEKHDLMHKAVGWMLREMGKRDISLLRKFLDTNATNMPRTMLRYAIEKMEEEERKGYLLKKAT